jgi:hypothetical protein
MGMRSPNFHYSADPHDISAQIDLFCAPERTVANVAAPVQIGGDARAHLVIPSTLCYDRGPTTLCYDRGLEA